VELLLAISWRRTPGVFNGRGEAGISWIGGWLGLTKELIIGARYLICDGYGIRLGVMDGWMGGWVDGWMVGWLDGRGSRWIWRSVLGYEGRCLNRCGDLAKCRTRLGLLCWAMDLSWF